MISDKLLDLKIQESFATQELLLDSDTDTEAYGISEEGKSYQHNYITVNWIEMELSDLIYIRDI